MTELYAQLLKLTEVSKSFFFKDEFMLGHMFRIFNYRYCSYSDWLKPGALECRGIMFEMDGGKPVRIASRPMEKFFNLNENEFTANTDETKIARVVEKMDGSLISSYVVNNLLFMKSKASLSSDQALFAKNLAYEMGAEFVQDLLELDSVDYTVNMEYVAPHNRVVLPYQEEKLVVLNVRHKESGKYMSLRQIRVEFPKVWDNFVFGACVSTMSDYQRQVMLNANCIKEIEGIEGYIWIMDTGQMIKVKTDWYVAKHKAKDGALNFRYCVEAVLEEKSDDIRAALYDDLSALELLNRVEEVVRAKMSHAVAKVEEFHYVWKENTRKEYSIRAQSEMGNLFHLTMQAYTGQELDVAGFIRKQYDRLKVECGAEQFERLEE